MSKVSPIAKSAKVPVKAAADEHSPDVLLAQAAAQSDRRQVIKDIIVSHYTSGATRKLKLVDVAERAGITRQALDRYYSEFKPYIAGKKDVTDLVDGTAAKAKVETQATINATDAKWKARLDQVLVERDKEIARAINSHISTLMNDDIAMFESNQLRKSLEKQTLHAVELMKKNSILELKLAAASQREAPLQSASSQNKIIYDVDIEQLCIHYQRTKSLDDFEDAKEAELMAIREKFARFTSMPDVHVVLFADRYISRFRNFASQYAALPGETCLIIRLPLFSRAEINNFIKHIPAAFKKSLHVPYMLLDTERKAQRVFIYQRNALPEQEIRAADNADAPSMTWGLDELVFFKVPAGD
ncbi:hypothetical protein [Pseudomonas paracarnis]|uniref:hypothetical protein n=1 Tax=Pseudomonas paracarnis TaxID=2750625 RepID=UPI002938F1A4|nr:hypothetical protein [Pseudomonas paracarnis]MDV3055456.1 hypothetical protein [Pseudomonas paracarnis]